MRGGAAQSLSGRGELPSPWSGGRLGRSEDRFQGLSLLRLLDDRHRTKPRLDALNTVTCHEDERDTARYEHIGDWINKFSSQIDIDNSGVDVLVNRGNHRLGKPTEGPYHRKPKLGQN